jgi:tetratricopeptide (TPR) repeat protein
MQFPGQMDAAMKNGCIFVALGLMACILAAPAQAGVYSTIEPKWELSSDYFRKFQEQWIQLKQLATPQAELPWQKSVNLTANLAMLIAKEPPSRGQPDPLKPEDRLDLAACLMRIRYPGKQMPEKAIQHLNAAMDRDRDNFLVMSTLGTAYQMTGDYSRANDNLSEANLRYWSKPFDELSAKSQAFLKQTLQWTSKDFAWFAKCEKYQRQLVRLRLRELKTGPLTMTEALEHLDPIFDDPGKPPLRFVGESGNFEIGKMAAAEKAKLPPDAIEIVEQLLIWLPDDIRLTWQLGELLNAGGDRDGAKIVYQEILDKFAQAQSRGFANIDPKTGQPQIDSMSFLPKLLQKHPEVGNRVKAVIESVAAPPGDLELPVDAKPLQTPKTAVAKPVEPPVAQLQLDWQTLGVGLGGGAIAGFLLAWRLRDVLRRRQTISR